MDFCTNYSIKANKAYTEDGVLVHNIFVFKIPRNVTQEELHKYFSQFSDEIEVHLVDDKKGKSGSKEAFINFSNPITAVKVLLKTDHKLQSKPIFVKACDSWNQPQVEKLFPNDTSTALPSLLQLNDDCLEYIFKLLHLRDQVHLARLCQRLRNVQQMACKIEYKVFDWNLLQGMTLWEIREILELIGPTLETINGFGLTHNRVGVFVANFCPNVKSINFDELNVDSAYLHKFLVKIKLLIDLKFNTYMLFDDHIMAIQKLANLECLTISKNFSLTGEHLDKLVNVKYLNLSGCSNIESNYFISICKSLKELKSLNIKCCYKFSETTFNEMAKHCHKLEVLKMSRAEECVARLPVLKSLHINDYMKLTKMIIPLLVALKEHAQQLEHLTIYSQKWLTYEHAVLIAGLKKLKLLSCKSNGDLDDNCLRKFAEMENLEDIDISDCQSITNEGLIFLIDKCTKLKCVNVQHCKNVTDIFGDKATEILNRRQNQQKEQLLVHVYGSGMHKSFESVRLKISSGFLQNVEAGDDDIEYDEYNDEYYDDNYYDYDFRSSDSS